MSLAGVYVTSLKDGTPSYRAGITIHSKHISLGSYASQDLAHCAYLEATALFLPDCGDGVNDYHIRTRILPFHKYISLLNLRDHEIYFKTPIYLGNRCFYYYMDPDTVLTFDLDDLFYYSTHTIMKRGGHLFVADYGMQVNILSRYGIREHAICPRDYQFINGDCYDFRYSNIRIVNRYHGVTCIQVKGQMHYKTRIHINGDFVVGTYSTEEEAAIAYNKAADILKKNGCTIRFRENYPENISNKDYATIYQNLKISKRIRELHFN